MQHLTIAIVFTTLLISLVLPGGTLAQQAPARAPLVAPPGAVRQFQTRFDVVDAPEQFDQVLQIVDFPAGTWTPLHTPGGYVYTSVIDGAITTRLPGTDGASEAAYEAGQTFVEIPGEYMQVGNATASNTRIMATTLLPRHAPLTIYQDGFTSSAYPTLTNWNYTHDMIFSAPGPETVYRSVIAVDQPEGAFELVQLVLDLTDPSRLLSSPEEEPRESCSLAWSRMTGNMLNAYTHQFERVASNLCVSSAYVLVRAAPSRADSRVRAVGVDLERAADLYRPAP